MHTRRKPLTRYEICSPQGLACALVASHTDILSDADRLFTQAVSASSPGYAVRYLLSLRREDDDLTGSLNDAIFALDLGDDPVSRVVRATIAGADHDVRFSIHSSDGDGAELPRYRPEPWARVVRILSGDRIVRLCDEDTRIVIDRSLVDPVRMRPGGEGLTRLIQELADGMGTTEAAARHPHVEQPMIDYLRLGIEKIAQWERNAFKVGEPVAS